MVFNLDVVFEELVVFKATVIFEDVEFAGLTVVEFVGNVVLVTLLTVV